jgi:hypothetical protein
MRPISRVGGARASAAPLGMLTWWLDNDAPCPIEELALLVFQHNAAGVVGFRTGG